jgi:hypothetical protein
MFFPVPITRTEVYRRNLLTADSHVHDRPQSDELPIKDGRIHACWTCGAFGRAVMLTVMLTGIRRDFFISIT